jgi:hypothetical protein
MRRWNNRSEHTRNFEIRSIFVGTTEWTNQDYPLGSKRVDLYQTPMLIPAFEVIDK